jgi:hypothetical protein
MGVLDDRWIMQGGGVGAERRMIVEYVVHEWF